jgi:hypothetical protein
MAFNVNTLGRLLRAAAKVFRAVNRTSTSKPPAAGRGRAPYSRLGPATEHGRGELSGPYPGDFRGRASVTYSPSPDGEPDPGEIVWTWVPYEEDHSKGKDRPVLLVGRNSQWLLALMMTSKDRNNGTSSNEDYVDIGYGSWDSRGRPSEVKLDRVLQLDPRDIRREGAVLGEREFSQVARALRQTRGWN